MPRILFLLLLFVASSAITQINPESSSSSITVHVLHEGRPIAGAEVYQIHSMDRNHDGVGAAVTRIGQTGGSGTISVPVRMQYGRIRDGSRVFARIPGQLAGFTGMYIFTDPDSVVIHLYPSRTVSGVVKDEKGRPVTGVKVTAWRIDGDGANAYHGIELEESIPGITAFTNAQGRFRLEGIPEPSRICLKTTAEGFAGLDIQRIPAGTDNLALFLEPESRITGRVTFETGAPAKGMRILGQAKLSTRTLSGVAECITDEDGRYTLEKIASGMYVIKVTPDSTLREWVAMPLVNVGAGRGKTVEHADIKLVRGITVTGRVIEKETGKPMPGEPVSASQIISQEQQTNWWNQRVSLPGAWTDGNGEFRFQALPGEVEVNTYPIKGNPSLGSRRGGILVKVAVKEGEPVEPVVLRFERGVDIRGIVRNPDGSPAADVRFVRGPETYAYSDIRGEFMLPGISRGYTFPFRAVSPKGNLMEDFSVRADSLDRVEVILHEPEYFAVEGAVLDEKGNPIAGIPVDLDSTGGLVLTFRPSATVTGGDGRFIMEHIPGGTLFRFSVRNGLGVSTSFQAENVRQPLRIVLPSADRWLEGTVRDADGKPMAGIILHISSDKGQAEATTDRTGHFRVEGLAAKQVGLYYSGLLGFFEFHGVATNERRDFILPTGRHYLSGRVTDIRNKPISGAAVEITRKEKWGWPAVIQTDSRGHFYFSALGQRSVTLRVSSPGYREQIRPVQTDREDVRFRLEKAANE